MLSFLIFLYLRTFETSRSAELRMNFFITSVLGDSKYNPQYDDVLGDVLRHVVMLHIITKRNILCVHYLPCRF